AGLSLEASRGLEYNPLTKRYWLSADASVNYLLACRKPA
ncbi:MAG TPA: bifunctional 3-demethylubiquinol 3-O-methyltransferase/2-polyprenyl-6-hydroxyphenol methylase, partial [Rhizobacter sp.]|nr:bifunctional 3-demethylubiquinol 3-O-methyltransferase/2-polyprenyl-6-hydroxyphenol methylase [Rhizobacter sp.]